MGRVLGCGPGSIEGLRWLARVGPCPLDAWRSAMGWSEVAARSHARRLEAAGWLVREPMIRGDGCLFWATRSGTAEAAVSARPVRRVTAATWPEHCVAAWTASWLKLCGHEFLGQREILQRPEWAAEIRWRDRRGSYRATARPDLVAILDDGDCVSIQFELTRTSPERRRANLAQHASWQAAGQSAWAYTSASTNTAGNASGCRRQPSGCPKKGTRSASSSPKRSSSRRSRCFDSAALHRLAEVAAGGSYIGYLAIGLGVRLT